MLLKKGEKTDTTLFKKIEKANELGLISDKTKKLLLDIKNIRNKIAHDIFYHLDFNDIFELLVYSSEAGVVYSDDCIWRNRKLSFEFYGINGLLNELFPNTFSMLVEDNNGLLSNEEYCGLMF